MPPFKTIAVPFNSPLVAITIEVPEATLAWLVHVVLIRLAETGCYVIGEEVAEFVANRQLDPGCSFAQTFNGASGMALARQKATDLGKWIDVGSKTQTPPAEALRVFEQMGGFMSSTEMTLRKGWNDVDVSDVDPEP